jgi:hypothetical protein
MTRLEDYEETIYREFTSLVDEQSLRIKQLEAFILEIIDEAKERGKSPEEKLSSIVTMSRTALRMKK